MQPFTEEAGVIPETLIIINERDVRGQRAQIIEDA